MADSTTAKLQMVKPEVGGSTDTWGVKINADLDVIDGMFDTLPVGGPVVKVANGGTGAASADAARTSLGLGALATSDGSTPFVSVLANTALARAPVQRVNLAVSNVRLTLPDAPLAGDIVEVIGYSLGCTVYTNSIPIAWIVGDQTLTLDLSPFHVRLVYLGAVFGGSSWAFV